MGREGCAAQTHHAACLDSFEHCIAVLRNLGHKGIGEIYALCPFVSFNSYLNVGHAVAGNVLSWGYALDRSADGTVYIGRKRTRRRLGYDLTCLDLVSDRHARDGWSSEVLGHRDIDSLWKRENLGRTVAADLTVVRMYAANSESLHSLFLLLFSC